MTDSYLNDFASSPVTLRVPDTAPDWASATMSSLVEFTSDLPPVGDLPDALDALAELAEFDAHHAFASPLLGELFARVRSAALPAIKAAICANTEAEAQAASDYKAELLQKCDDYCSEIRRLKSDAAVLPPTPFATPEEAAQDAADYEAGFDTAVQARAKSELTDPEGTGVPPETAEGGIAQGATHPAGTTFSFVGKQWRLRNGRVVFIMYAADGVLYADHSPDSIRWPVGTLKGFEVRNGVVGHNPALDIKEEISS